MIAFTLSFIITSIAVIALLAFIAASTILTILVSAPTGAILVIGFALIIYVVKKPTKKSNIGNL